MIRVIASMCAILVLVTPAVMHAQSVFVGVGLGGQSVPRGLAPLCGAARRMTGATASLYGGLLSRFARISTSLSVTTRGYTDVAGCVPLPVGIHTDSSFADAGSSVTVAAVDVWLLPAKPYNIGVGAGWVPGHDSRFVSAGLGLGYSRFRLEMSARRYRTSFDEVTRNVTLQGATEIDRVRRAENSWGGLIALVLVTR